MKGRPRQRGKGQLRRWEVEEGEEGEDREKGEEGGGGGG